MRLIDDLTERLAVEPSPFRAQLLREDLVRLHKLCELARAAPDLETYKHAGRRLGWTAQDARTSELGEALERLLEAVHEAQTSPPSEAADAKARLAWIELTRVRMERLVGCLSTPVPKPVD